MGATEEGWALLPRLHKCGESSASERQQQQPPLQGLPSRLLSRLAMDLGETCLLWI